MRVHHAFPHVLALFVLGAVVAEIAWYLFIQKRSYPWQDMLVSISISAMRIPAKALAALLILPVALFFYSHRIATVPLNTVWGLGLLFLAVEFAYYWMHRAGHEVRWMWASHMVHHTPEHIHFASAFRIGATEFFSGTWLFFLPLSLLGFNPVAVTGVMAINLSYQFWLHTDLIGRLGPLEWIFNTPSHHRVHHASNNAYLDRNYGGILIIWDRLFGTYAKEDPDSEICYGLVHPIKSLNPFRITFHEWHLMARDFAAARSWKERWRQLFGRPADSLTAGGMASSSPDTQLIAAE